MDSIAAHQQPAVLPPTLLSPSPPTAPTQPDQPQSTKALRFVTNYGAPHPKRRRIGAACMTCRKRKTACSGERPHCETCKQNRQECAGYASEATTAAVPPTRKRKSIEHDTTERKDFAKKPSISSDNGLSRTQSGGNDLTRVSSGGQSPRSVGESGSRTGELGRDSLFAGPRNRMPYFRWLGPTAIMPGFKQMVVKVKRNEADIARSSTDGGVRSPTSLNRSNPNEPRLPNIYSGTSAAAESDVRSPPINLPFYDTSPMPPSELITHLVTMFFTHLGCNYPFLQRTRFLRDLEEKQVDAILVDAVCALAARFSTHPLLTELAADGEKASPAEYGHAFAQRAKTALIDTFPCPSVAAAQAALLLAYNEFGEQRDSGLWMYLGIAIRLAQDLGLHKLEGLKYSGRIGPTPRQVKQEQRNAVKSKKSASAKDNGVESEKVAANPQSTPKAATPEQEKVAEETKEVERERIDTFWAIFFLDRVVSSGTGRRVTLRDKDIEISFPSMSETHANSDWPAPFPALIRIVHLYGRVADLLNSLKEVSDVSADVPKRLAAMESQVTQFYQGLSPKLHFDAVNFQHYMKAGEGTNFVLLHFWFHLLIVLLHQPTLLLTFKGRMLQLFPNSQQLSMSSAKTIADILSYSQLMDAKASLGNPFTTQPIYIAACAFLRETAEQTATSNAQSRASSPHRSSAKDALSESTPSSTPKEHTSRKASIASVTESPKGKSDAITVTSVSTDQKSQLAKHTLLATAATQHYQLCYKALQSLETYWAGTKYILTILDQKADGVEDPLLYTAEEGECSMEVPRPDPAFTSPGWRRKLSLGPYAFTPTLQSSTWPPRGFSQVPASPGVDASKAIGWALTGNMNSNSTNLSWHYTSDLGNIDAQLGSMNPPPPRDAVTSQMHNVEYTKHMRGGSTSSQSLSGEDDLARQAAQQEFANGASTADAESLLALRSPFHQSGGTAPSTNILPTVYHNSQQQGHQHGLSQMHAPERPNTNGNINQQTATAAGFMDGQLPMNFMPGDMMIESHNVDMNMLGLEWFDPFPVQDTMPSFYNPQIPDGGQ